MMLYTAMLAHADARVRRTHLERVILTPGSWRSPGDEEAIEGVTEGEVEQRMKSERASFDNPSVLARALRSLSCRIPNRSIDAQNSSTERRSASNDPPALRRRSGAARDFDPARPRRVLVERR